MDLRYTDAELAFRDEVRRFFAETYPQDILERRRRGQTLGKEDLQRSEKALVVGLMEMYLEGVSTRKVTDVTEALCGTGFSKSTVSRLAGELDGDLATWRERRLDDVAYVYLVVDARYEHVRIAGQVTSQGVLIVKGVREDGRRELLAVDVADTESEATYDQLEG